ncbi:MAG: hypothetical protein OHK0024_02790 [Thalassobaculales bacterium]
MLSFDEFKMAEGTTFRVSTAPSGICELRLAAATRLPRGGRPAQLPDPFVLRFTGPPDRPLPQGLHRFSHPALGTRDIFITVKAPSEAGDLRCYEAVVN